MFVVFVVLVLGGSPDLAAFRASLQSAEDAGAWGSQGDHRIGLMRALRGVARGPLCGEGRGIKPWGEAVSCLKRTIIAHRHITNATF